MKKSIIQTISSFFVLIFAVSFFSCKEIIEPEIPTDPPTLGGMCGLPRFVSQIQGTGGASATYLSVDNIRTFRYNIVAADTVCVYSRPRITWKAHADVTTGHPLTIVGGVQWSTFEKRNAGSTIVNSTGEHWTAIDSISFGTSFGTGPGRITNAYIDISFLSHGDLGLDEFYMIKKFDDGSISARIDYDYYVAN